MDRIESGGLKRIRFWQEEKDDQPDNQGGDSLVLASEVERRPRSAKRQRRGPSPQEVTNEDPGPGTEGLPGREVVVEMVDKVATQGVGDHRDLGGDVQELGGACPPHGPRVSPPSKVPGCAVQGGPETDETDANAVRPGPNAVDLQKCEVEKVTDQEIAMGADGVAGHAGPQHPEELTLPTRMTTTGPSNELMGTKGRKPVPLSFGATDIRERMKPRAKGGSLVESVTSVDGPIGRKPGTRRQSVQEVRTQRMGMLAWLSGAASPVRDRGGPGGGEGGDGPVAHDRRGRQGREAGPRGDGGDNANPAVEGGAG